MFGVDLGLVASEAPVDESTATTGKELMDRRGPWRRRLAMGTAGFVVRVTILCNATVKWPAHAETTAREGLGSARA
jgi:hypothetical protein